MATITVGRGQQYATVAEAVAASRDGDVLQVQAGTYTNDFASITTDITLKAVGGMVHMKATGAPPNGKAIFVTRGDITIEGFEFSGTKVRDGNGAGIRHEDGDLTILSSHFHHNQMGILTIARNPDATLTIRDSEFDHNGIGDGRTHNLYVGKIGRLEVDDSYFHDVPVGHLLKSRAEETVITDSRFFGHASSASYEIDLPNGGRAVLRDNVIQQGPNSQNPAIVAFGEEGNLHPGSRIEMSGNTVVNDLSGRGPLLWNKAGAPASLTDNDVFGLVESRILRGPGEVSGTRKLDTPPKLDLSSPWKDAPSRPDPEPDPDPGPGIPGGAERLVGTMGDDVLAGGAGAERIQGRGGDDALTGGAGDDSLHAGEGDDTVEGGAGDDVIMGWRGDDLFVFGPGFGHDRLHGFEQGGDRLDISALGIAPDEFAQQVAFEQRGGRVAIEIEGHGRITIAEADATQFDSSDFILG
jgi:hypothetical protein